MHLRLNIPCWGARELIYGVRALASLGLDQRFRCRLQGQIEQEVDGWTVGLVSSARRGIVEAARSLGLQGARFAVPGYVCPTVVAGLRYVGATIVPIDCANDSLMFDSAALIAAVDQDQVDAIFSPNTYGVDQDYELLRSLDVPVVEDAAYQAGLRSGGGGYPGLRGHAGVWSFNFKALTGIGGGIVFLPGGSELERIDGWQGITRWWRERLLFFNYLARAVGRHRIPKALGGARHPEPEPEGLVRPCFEVMYERPMSELQACLALAQWERREQLFRKQRENTALILDAIDRSHSFSSALGPGNMTAVQLFPILVTRIGANRREARDLVRDLLYERGVQTESPYPVIIASADRLPNAQDLADRLVLVPCHPSLVGTPASHISSSLGIADHALRDPSFSAPW